MKPQTQIKIGKISAGCLAVLCLIVPPFITIDAGIEAIDSWRGFVGLYGFCAIVALFLFVYIWMLNHNRSETVTNGFVVYSALMWSSLIYGGLPSIGVDSAIIHIIIWFLLLQGVLGARKLRRQASKEQQKQ